MADPATTMKAIDYALSEIPELKAFLDKPGVSDLILKASQEQWPPARLQAGLYETPYWQSTTDAQRGWDVLAALNPSERDKRWLTAVQHAWDVIGKLGVDNLTVDQLNPWISFSIANGFDDRTLQQGVINMMKGKPPPTTGDLAAAMTYVQGQAADFGVTMSHEGAFGWAQQMAEKRADQSSITEAMKQAAISQYGGNAGLVDALNRGQTVRQYADPYISMAAKELNIAPDQISMTDPKWNRFLSTQNPDGTMGMNLTDWQRTIRTDPGYNWQNTPVARDLATQTAQGILQHMGASM